MSDWGVVLERGFVVSTELIMDAECSLVVYNYVAICAAVLSS